MQVGGGVEIFFSLKKKFPLRNVPGGLKTQKKIGGGGGVFFPY